VALPPHLKIEQSKPLFGGQHCLFIRTAVNFLDGNKVAELFSV
jgi:hypothetical protein